MTSGRQRPKSLPARPAQQDSAGRLRALQRALARRGIASDLDTRSAWPRLHVRGRADATDSGCSSGCSIVAIAFDDDWWFAHAEKISEAASVRPAADLIALELASL